MHIRSLQIRNYKGFLASEEITFTEGFNVIVGQNNVGKTVLVEALSLQFGNVPHRSFKTLPDRNSVQEPHSTINISFEISHKEMLNMFRNTLRNFHVQVPIDHSRKLDHHNILDFLYEWNTFRCTFQSGTLMSAYPEHIGEKPREAVNNVVRIHIENGVPKAEVSGTGTIKLEDSLPGKLVNILKERIYIFKAERMGIGASDIGPNSTLASNATDLPRVLHLLQSSNVARFQRFNQLVNIVFPEITQITVPPITQNRAHILVWSIDPASERDDLAVPLAESGTGIGQVLAMLYVVLTSEAPRTIVIDEPQSFLHPGAIRKLFDIFKQFPQHQYIITTHSPTAVTAADPQTLYIVRKIEGESIVEAINVAQTQHLRVFLSEIGARLSDVFGADYILWVEGRTEELCFPLIFAGIIKQPLFGTAILGVISTSNFEGKHAKTAWEIYRRLSRGTGLLPPAIGFIFDQEGRSKQSMEDLERESKGAVTFLPRRMYENYLLNPCAIASIMAGIEGLRERQITVAEVEEWLQCNRWNRKFMVYPIVKTV